MRIRLIAILGLLVSSCGAPDTTSGLKNISSNDRLLVLAMGGRSSCGRDQNPKDMSMYPQVEKLLDILKEKHPVQAVFTCFDRSANLYIENQKRPVMADDLIAVANNTEKDHVLLIGHSYGGWLAMRTVLGLNKRAHLYTIDAISPIDCELTKPTSWLGCQRAPKDISWDFVASNSFTWQHFYQTTTPYLHSTAIPKAENQHIPDVGHTKIDEAPQVWYKIRNKL